MAIQGSFGKIRVFEDFLGITAQTLSDATPISYGNGVVLAPMSGDVAVTATIDESGGVAAFSGAGAAADGIVIYCMPFVAGSNGPLRMEARFKSSSVTDLRVYCGFQETAAVAEPVIPLSLSGTTLTANATGESVGFYFDSAATTDDFRFMAASNSSASTTAALDYALGGQTTLGSLGVRCNATPTADRWTVARVEVDPDGAARGYLGDETMANTNGMTHIASLRKGDLSTTAVLHPILHLVAVSTGDPTFEVDYFFAEGSRDWRAD